MAHLITGIPSYMLAVIVIVAIAMRLLHNRYGHGLHHIPGPILASFTDFWRLIVVRRRRPERNLVHLHEQLGSVVRIGPRTLSFSDPDAIPVIYGLKSGFTKSDFYPVQQTVANGRRLHTMFNTTDETFHAKLRRAVSGPYAMSTLIQFEPLVDSTTAEFIKQLEYRYAKGPNMNRVFDLGAWLQFFAFDVIGELTYSCRLGFVDKGIDVDNIISSLERLFEYFAVIGQMPKLDSWFLKNPLRLWASSKGFINSNTAVVDFARQRIAARPDPEAFDMEKCEGNSSGTIKQRDFLSRFYEAHRKDPDFISKERVLALTVANMAAGSDTTAISLRSVFYHLLRSPADKTKLMKELADAQRSGLLGRNDGLVGWDEVRDLTFLGAVIKEALRCHPAVGLPLERVTPSQGARICGVFVPGGTIVGCSAWAVHQSTAVFGSDANKFRPERWLQASTEQKKIMERSLFSFGAGSRTCIGKNISWLEMYKLVPALLMNFEIELADPAKEWTLQNAFFVRQEDFYVYLGRI